MGWDRDAKKWQLSWCHFEPGKGHANVEYESIHMTVKCMHGQDSEEFEYMSLELKEDIWP